MMKTTTSISFVVLALSLLFMGCGKIYGPVKEAEKLADLKAGVIEEMGKKLKGNPTLAGVAEARKAFDAKKAELTATRDAIKAAPKAMNVDWDTTLSAIEARQAKALDDIGTQLRVSCSYPCEDVSSAWDTLRKDFDSATNRY